MLRGRTGAFLVGLLCAGAMLTGCAVSGTDTGAGENPMDPAADSAVAAQESEEVDYFAETLPVFDAVTETGSGDAVITLPAMQGTITATHSGSANFILTVLDTDNAMTELPVNTIGTYEGTTAFGLQVLGGEAATLQIAADGDWEITIAPISEAPELTDPQETDGDGVYLYRGGAATWQLSHDGDANFIVSFISDDLFGYSLLVNEIGSYDGTVPVTAGPGVVVVNADGSWTISAA
jgi:hypothetical protein